MAERFSLTAVLEGRNESSGAFREAIGDARDLGEALDRLDGREVGLDARLDDGATEPLKEIDRFADRLDGRDIDMRVDVDAGGGLASLAMVEAARDRLDGKDIDMSVDVDTAGAVGQLVAFRGAAGGADATASGFLGTIRDMGSTIRSAGLVSLLPALVTGLYALGPATQVAGGGLLAIGGMAASAGLGVGLLAGAIAPSIKRFSDYKEAVDSASRKLESAEKGTKEYREAQRELARAQKILTDNERELAAQWGKTQNAFMNNRGFKSANNDLLDLADDALKLTRRIMPDLGEEAEETAKSFSSSARTIAREWGTQERNSVTRILDNASDTIGDLTRSFGRGGQGLANLIGSPAAVRGAKEFSGYLEDITTSFRGWTRTERARDAVADWLDRAKTVGKGARDAFSGIADAIGRFDDRDAKNAADLIRGIGNAVGFMIDESRDVGRKTAALFDWFDEVMTKLDKLDGKLKDGEKDVKGWWDELESGMLAPGGAGAKFGRWLTDMYQDKLPKYGKALDDNEEDLSSWQRNLLKNLEQSEKDWGFWLRTVGRFLGVRFPADLKENEEKTGKWSDDNSKHVKDFQTFGVARLLQFADKGLGHLVEFSQKSSEKMGGWRKKEDGAWGNFISDINHIFDEGWAGVVDVMMARLNPGLERVQGWVDRVKGILGGIMDFLGIDTGGSGSGHAGSPTRDSPSSSGHAGSPTRDSVRRYEGGLYEGNVRRMADGGIVDASGVYTALTTGMDLAASRGAVWQAAGGGMSDGMVPRVIYGEGHPGDGPKKEAWIPEDMEPGAAMRVLSETASWFGKALVDLGRTESHAHGADYPSMQRFLIRNPNAGMPKGLDDTPRFMAGGGIYTINAGNVDAETWAVASQAADKFRYLNEPGTTYSGHGADGDPRNSIDLQVSAWGTVAQGGQFQTGEAIKNWASGLPNLDYIIWNKMANYGGGWEPYRGGGGYAPPSDPSGYHQDHVHLEIGGDGVSGGGGSGFDVMGWIANQLKKIPAPDLGSGAFFGSLATGAKDWAIDKIMDWAASVAGSLGFTGSGSEAGGNLEQWAKSGLQYGNVVDPSASNIGKIKALAMKESGGDPSAQNPDSTAAGLMQVIDSTFAAYRVADSDDVMNPVHNVAASSRYQKDRYGGLVTHSPYTNGGIALTPQLATVAERGPEFFMPLDKPETATRFLDFMENFHSLRVTRRTPAPAHRQPEAWDSFAAGGAGSSDAALLKRLDSLEDAVRNGTGFKPGEAERVGAGAATGTISRVVTDGSTKKRVADSQDGFVRTRNSLTGRSS